MKQHITEKQYNELSKERKDVWYKWAVKRGYTMRKVYGREHKKEMLLGFPSIGQMIEFVRDNDKKHLWTWYFFDGPHALTKDICDILWEAVKEILKK